jgi:hypothetical protein
MAMGFVPRFANKRRRGAQTALELAPGLVREGQETKWVPVLAPERDLPPVPAVRLGEESA